MSTTSLLWSAEPDSDVSKIVARPNALWRFHKATFNICAMLIHSRFFYLTMTFYQLKLRVLLHVLVYLGTAVNSEQCDMFLNGRCYQMTHRPKRVNWYEARNECLDGGGDLASFETLNDNEIKVSLKNLSLHSETYYWIGLQKNEWRWEDTGLLLCLPVSLVF